MGLSDIVAQAVSPAIAKVRRDVIAYALCAICGVAALIFIASASVLALEPQVGVIYARLILAGVFALVVVATLVTLRVRTRQSRRVVLSVAAPAPEADAGRRSAQFAQLAMIVEAVLLGYSMARRR